MLECIYYLLLGNITILVISPGAGLKQEFYTCDNTVCI